MTRLVCSGYAAAKITENVECEIMEVVAEEARSSYREEVVHELASNTLDDLEANVGRVTAWLEQWLRDNPHGVDSAPPPAEGGAGATA